MTEMQDVRFEVLGVERVAGAGKLKALAVVLVEVEGVQITLQGVQVVQGADGLCCRAPTFRHPRDGRWLPAVALPPVLADAIAAEVLEIAQG
ncbi:hypothetical protein CR162_16900 [Pseudoroseomonas rhizosphaerae]|uniref:Uncharacterized protein n=1 Tax=Teichococcus rhizosphaerae TaxID=1335062 RepID=A0A2C7A9R4_9PROT|nr:hypothetical protein [Pseudoroseomonas rhizosphaerae]PHK93794.1 hypothetical protein CR162_16900 [Pseudoroseomonas rhizosphaerae]